MKVLSIREGLIAISITIDEAKLISKACEHVDWYLVNESGVDRENPAEMEALAARLETADAMSTAFLALAAAGTAQMHVMKYRARCNREIAALLA